MCSMQSLRFPGAPKSNMNWTRRQVRREERPSSAQQGTRFQTAAAACRAALH